VGMMWALYPSPLPALKPYSTVAPIPVFAEIVVGDRTEVVLRVCCRNSGALVRGGRLLYALQSCDADEMRSSVRLW